MSLHNFLLFHFRSHIKNSCFVFHQGFQTPRNNKSTRPAPSCFHYFLGVWNSWWNTRTRFWYITWKPCNTWRLFAIVLLQFDSSVIFVLKWLFFSTVSLLSVTWCYLMTSFWRECSRYFWLGNKNRKIFGSCYGETTLFPECFVEETRVDVSENQWCCRVRTSSFHFHSLAFLLNIYLFCRGSVQVGRLFC